MWIESNYTTSQHNLDQMRDTAITHLPYRLLAPILLVVWISCHSRSWFTFSSDPFGTLDTVASILLLANMLEHRQTCLVAQWVAWPLSGRMAWTCLIVARSL